MQRTRLLSNSASICVRHGGACLPNLATLSLFPRSANHPRLDLRRVVFIFSVILSRFSSDDAQGIRPLYCPDFAKWRPPAHTQSVSPAAAAAADPADGCTATPRCRLPAVRCTQSCAAAAARVRVQFRRRDSSLALSGSRDGSHRRFTGVGFHFTRFSRVARGADFIQMSPLVCWLVCIPATAGMPAPVPAGACRGAAGGATPAHWSVWLHQKCFTENKLRQQVMQ